MAPAGPATAVSARPARRFGVNLQAGRSRSVSGGALTVLVCSSCHALLREGTPHCPRCGPGSLALFGSEVSALDPRPTSDSRALDRLAGTTGLREAIERGADPGAIVRAWELERRGYLERRKRFLLYPE